MAAPSFNELLSELKAEYLRAAPQRLDVMQRALHALDGNPADADALGQLRLTFHAWAGNGKTYGFPEVTRLGLEGDVQCAARQREGPPQAAEIVGWRVLTEAISRELQSPVGASPVPAPQGLSAVGRSARILSVDDDAHQCAFLRAVLSSAGYEVRTCGDPQRFLEEQRAFGPDLVLMDVVLPGTTGHELVGLLHAHIPTIPVIFVTTAGEVTESTPGEETEVLRKPIAPATLLAAVSRRLALSRP